MTEHNDLLLIEMLIVRSLFIKTLKGFATNSSKVQDPQFMQDVNFG